MKRTRLAWIMAGACFLAAGCESSPPRKPDLAPVQGVVLYRGERVKNAMVEFVQNGSPFRSMGLTDEQGQFQLTSLTEGDGAPVGANKVVVSIRKAFLDPRVFADAKVSAPLNADPDVAEPRSPPVGPEVGDVLRTPPDRNGFLEEELAEGDADRGLETSRQPAPAAGTSERDLPVLPTRYATGESSDLEFNVVKGRINHFEIVLTD